LSKPEKSVVSEGKLFHILIIRLLKVTSHVFRPMNGYILETTVDWNIITMEDE